MNDVRVQPPCDVIQYNMYSQTYTQPKQAIRAIRAKIRNTAKTIHVIAKIFGPPKSPFSCGVQYQVSLKSGNENMIKK